MTRPAPSGAIALWLAAAALWLHPPALAGDAPVFRFTEVARAAGVDFVMTSGKAPSREILEVNGGGVALLDYDNDGDLDLFLANGATLDSPDSGPGSRLYSNRGDGKFDDVSKTAGIDLRRWAMGVAVGDYDADGWDDLYVTCFGPNVLLRNTEVDGRRRFVDVSATAGVADSRWSTSAAFGDVDGDADLDLYVANYMEFDPKNPPPRRTFKGVTVFGGPMGTTAGGDALFENLGNGRFRNATASRGCDVENPGYGLGVVLLDFDDDGRTDIFVGNDSTTNFLFRRTESGVFKDTAYAAGVACNYDGRSQATMGIAVADVDGNGRPDLFTTNFSSDTNTLHLNKGRGMFEDRTSQFGLAAVSRPYLSWGTGFYDFDSDGDEDLFIASGHIYPEAAENDVDTEYEQPILLFERSGRRFSRYMGQGIFAERYSGRSTAFGDLDNDGDVDIVMTTLNGPVRVFRNEAPLGNQLVVELVGAPGNHRGIGSRIELHSGETVQRRWIDGGSYQSADATQAYFSVPPSGAKTKLKLRVVWPDGTSTIRDGILPGFKIQVAQGSSEHKTTPLNGHAEPTQEPTE